MSFRIPKAFIGCPFGGGPVKVTVSAFETDEECWGPGTHFSRVCETLTDVDSFVEACCPDTENETGAVPPIHGWPLRENAHLQWTDECGPTLQGVRDGLDAAIEWCDS